MATIQIVRKKEEPKEVNFREDMTPGQWGIGTLKTGATSYDAVVAVRRSQGFAVYPKGDFSAAKYLGRFLPALTITEILPVGTQVVITL